MASLFALAVGLVAATVVVALVTGQRLGERRKAVFQLEMTAEELCRRVAEAAERKGRTEDHLGILLRMREEKRQRLAALEKELRELQEGAVTGRQIRVSLGLRRRAGELVAA